MINFLTCDWLAVFTRFLAFALETCFTNKNDFSFESVPTHVSLRCITSNSDARIFGNCLISLYRLNQNAA